MTRIGFVTACKLSLPAAPAEHGSLKHYHQLAKICASTRNNSSGKTIIPHFKLVRAANPSRISAVKCGAAGPQLSKNTTNSLFNCYAIAYINSTR
jgi:hypothetical protein